MKRTTTIRLASLCCLLLAASPGFAQVTETTSSFESLGSASQLRNGERIEITDVTGKKLSAKFEGISESVLTARSGDSTLRFTKEDIAQIQRRKPERWWDGMLIGMGVGAASGAAAVAGICKRDSECSFYAGVVVIPIMAGGGAGVGAIIDSLFHKNETVYSRDSGSVLRRLDVAPLVGKDMKGVQVSLSF
jgi:hypothetical protein